MNIMKCKKHGIEFNFMVSQCPMCLADRSAYEFTLRAMTCGLCGELKSSTVIMCGGAIGRLCEDCRALIKKWEEAKKRHQERFEKIQRSKEKANE